MIKGCQIIKNKFDLTPEVYKALDYIQETMDVTRQEVYSIVLAVGVHEILDQMGAPTDLHDWKSINRTSDKEMYGQ